MLVVRGYKTELDLNNEQRTACLKHAGCARYAYNWGLARSIAAYRTTGKRPSAIDLHRELNALKKTEFPWMYEVSKCAMQEALRDLDTAYKNFFRRCRGVINHAPTTEGKWKGKLGFPVFKKKSKGIGSFRLTGFIHVFSDAVQLPRLGRLRLHEHGYLPTNAKVFSATVSEEAGRWFVSVQVEIEQTVPERTATTAIGVDLGIKTLATLSDGTTFANPRALKHAQKRLRRLERQKARRVKGSQNRKKTVKKLAKQHARVAHMRRDATHKFGCKLTKECRPCCICNTLCQTMVLYHPSDGEVFHADDAVVVDDLAAFLMGEVLTTERDALMYPCNGFTVLLALFGTFYQMSMRPLYVRQGFFLFAEKARVSNLSPIRARGKGGESYINANRCVNWLKAFRLALARERHIPLASRSPMHRTRFHGAPDRTMIDHLDGADFRETYPMIVRDTET